MNTVANAPPQASPALLTQWTKLQARAANLPPAVCDMAQAGLRKLVDYQDLACASTYLDRLEGLLRQDSAEKGFAFTLAAAKHIANAMAYDDVIRVADLKTRAGRIERIKQEMGAEDRHLMLVTEFMHPRAEELVGLLPARLGRWMEARPRAMRLVDRIFNKGRHLRSDGLWAFLQLYALSGLRGRRRRSLRYAQELAHLEAWLQTAQGYLPQNYDLAVEILLCRRLIKGYSDTHARGMSKFDKVLGGAAKVAARKDGADWVRRLREAALKDEEGKALDGALATIRSFAG